MKSIDRTNTKFNFLIFLISFCIVCLSHHSGPVSDFVKTLSVIRPFWILLYCQTFEVIIRSFWLIRAIKKPLKGFVYYMSKHFGNAFFSSINFNMNHQICLNTAFVETCFLCFCSLRNLSLDKWRWNKIFMI